MIPNPIFKIYPSSEYLFFVCYISTPLDSTTLTLVSRHGATLDDVLSYLSHLPISLPPAPLSIHSLPRPPAATPSALSRLFSTFTPSSSSART